jgi:glycerol-3-phosphate cytidylyltransferase-like family protein
MTKESFLATYKDLFEGLGKLHEPYDIRLRPDVTPVVHPPRRVPLTLHTRLKKKLDDMESSGVITKTERATEWVNSTVVVEKRDGSLRVCLDPRNLNRAIMREHHMLATSQDVVSQMAGKKIFTVLDQKDSYWQIPLTEKSSDLCTFNNPFGRYSFLRMPFGISSASEVLQKRNQQLFGNIPNVHIVADDMIIATDSEQEHDAALRSVMEVARQHNCKFNKEKIKFKQPELVFLGNVIGQDGMKPDEEKVKAINEMTQPQCKENLLRFLGMVNYLSQFTPNMSAVSAPLRQLLKKDCVWQWNAEHSKALNSLKTLISSKPVLSFFDAKKSTVIQCDASSKGLGACLLQDNHPIAFASRSLMSSECNYSQIEKELLAILFAARKFHHYVYGRLVEVHSDHKPLEMITKKPLYKASPRLQQMLLQLMRYDLNVKYVPGKEMYIADTLSRAYLASNSPPELNEQYVIHSVAEMLPISKSRLDEIKMATSDDVVLQALIGLCENGWPMHRRSCPEFTRQYWNIRDEIHTHDGLLFVGDRILIPENLRSAMMDILHEGHLGMEKCKLLARSTIY